MLLAGDQGLQSSTHGRPLNPALFLCGKNRQNPQTLLFFEGYDSASVTQILIPGALSSFPEEYNMLHHGLVMQMWQRGWCEAGEGHCVDPVPQGCRRWSCGGTPGLSKLEGWCRLPDLSLSDGCLCQRSHPGKVTGAGVQLYRAVRWAVKSRRPSLSRGVLAGTVHCPDPGRGCCGGCTHRNFHPCCHQEPTGTFISTCKEARHCPDSLIFPLSRLKHSLR